MKERRKRVMYPISLMREIREKITMTFRFLIQLSFSKKILSERKRHEQLYQIDVYLSIL